MINACNLIARVVLFLMLFTTHAAHADFRKALDAYMARDGETMLKEVKDAVEKKNDDGLILFISATDIDHITSRKSSFEPELKPQRIDLTKIKSTLETILTETQHKELFDLLDCASTNGSVEARYKFIHSAIYVKYQPKANMQYGLDNELVVLADKGSVSSAYELYISSENDANRYKWLLKAADNGSANAAYDMAMLCYSKERGTVLQTLTECKVRSEEKMFYWLKQALKNQHGGAYWVRGRIAAELGRLYLKGFRGQVTDAKEAYLWALVAINNDGDSIFDDSLLGDIHKKGLLKQVDPILGAQLEQSWNDEYKRRELVQTAKTTSLPKLLKELSKVDTPIFSFHSISKERLPSSKKAYLSVGAHDIDIYADGRVKLNFGYIDSRKENTETFFKLTPQQLQRFIENLKELKISDWVNAPESCTDNFCVINQIQYFVVNLTDKDEQSFKISLVTPKDITPTNPSGKRFAQLSTLIEQYIPTQKLRCTLGSNAIYAQSCLNFYRQLDQFGE